CPCGNVIVVPSGPSPAFPRREGHPEGTAPSARPVAGPPPVQNRDSSGAVVAEAALTDDIQEPVQVAVLDEPLYISSDETVNRFREYCEGCKIIYTQSQCPGCGYDNTRGMRTGCMYCNVQYRHSRKNCPLCKVAVNLDKANKA